MMIGLSCGYPYRRRAATLTGLDALDRDGTENEERDARARDVAEPAHVSAEESRRKRWAEQARRSGTCRCGRQLGHAEVELHFPTCDDCGAGLGEGDMAWSCVRCDRDLCESCGSAPEGGQ